MATGPLLPVAEHERQKVPISVQPCEQFPRHVSLSKQGYRVMPAISAAEMPESCATVVDLSFNFFSFWFFIVPAEYPASPRSV